MDCQNILKESQNALLKVQKDFTRQVDKLGNISTKGEFIAACKTAQKNMPTLESRTWDIIAKLANLTYKPGIDSDELDKLKYKAWVYHGFAIGENFRYGFKY